MISKTILISSTLILLLQSVCTAQTGSIKGTVKSNGRPIEFANLGIPKISIGAITNGNGYFEIKNIPYGTYELRASYIGYESYLTTLIVSNATPLMLNIALKETSASLNEIVITGTQKETTKMDSPIPVEVYNPVFFKKNPTPTIFEALTMVNGVQPQLNCNVCNTGDIHINGMEGPYTMVLIDGMPIVSSLATVYGLSGIPNSMVKRIEIVKGPASTLYGSEAVGGIINIITKDPFSAPSFMLDVSGTSLDEYNLDISTKYKIKNVTSLLGVNVFWFNTIHDINKDDFTDFTLQKRISIFNKWNIQGKTGKSSSVAIRFLKENRWGGQTTWAPEWRGTDSIYGESIYTSRAEVIGNYGLPFKNEMVIFEYSYNYHLQDSYYGITKYFAKQQTAFGQFRWDKKIKQHDIMIGIPFRFTYYDDNTAGTATFATDTLIRKNKAMLTYLPGLFVQDEISFTGKLSVLSGLRYDHHNEHGNIFSPRLAFKYSSDKNNTFRLSGGNGFRVVNLFTEDHAALTGARQVMINETLKPEQSWNANGNYSGFINHNKGFIGVDASIFYTYFTNKIVADFQSDPQLIIYENLDGYAISKGLTANLDFSFTNGLKIIAGATFMDVYQVEKDNLSSEVKIQQLFAPKFSATFALSYSLPKLFTIDFTGKINGPMNLPVVPNDFRPGKSPWFGLLNIQLIRKFNNGIEFYGGVKNFLNFIPENPILRSNDPFDKNITVNNPNGYTFDPSYNYAPVQGIKGILGLRYNLYRSK